MNALEKLRDATRMLSEVSTATEAKQLADLAAAAKYYAQKAQLGKEAIDYAHSIYIDAMRLLGGFLESAPKNEGAKGKPGGGTRGTHKEPRVDEPPTLADIGLTKKQSSTAQVISRAAREAPKAFAEMRDGAKTVTAVRREIQRAEVKESAPLPASKYRVFYADPAWKYGDQLMENYGPTRFHYPPMSIADLCNLPVVEMCADDAVLFMWVTSPLLEECFPVIKAWGFKYKTSFVWDKIKHNMGHYNSVRHEFLLICTRGSCLPDVPELIDSVQSIERKAHSEKPEEFRAIIDKLYPRGKRIELFARAEATGWERWGNQA